MSADNLFAQVLGTPDADAAFSDRAVIAAMLRFEGELARCQERLGLIPAGVADVIERQARAVTIDPGSLVRDAQAAGSLAIPLVHALTESVRTLDPAAAAHVHFGATSQDVIDSALALCTRTALACIEAAVDRAIEAAIALARRHAADPVLARTLLQAAGVTTFGWKFAHAALALDRGRRRVRTTARASLAVALAGPTGNLEAFGEHGATLRAALAQALGLADPGASWHSHRDQWVALATDTALLVGTTAKIAGDLALMAQTEVGEVRMPASDRTGRSSAMPHKRNPVLAMRVLAASHPVPGIVAGLLAGMRQAHERGLGEWQSGLAQWPVLFAQAIDSTAALAALLETLEVDPVRARDNIDAQFGVLFSPALAHRFAAELGRNAAHDLVGRLCEVALRDRIPLRDVAIAAMGDDLRLQSIPATAITALFDIHAAAAPAGREVEALLGLIARP